MKLRKNNIIGTVYLLLLLNQVVLAYFGLAARKHILTDSIGYYPHLMEDRRELSAAKLCDLMMLQRKQRRICRRDKGVAHTLFEATKLSKFECDRQFHKERWNCSLAEKYRLNILKKGFKETSFLYAISSASLVHEFARACSRGSIDRCTCDESKGLKNKEAWLWGGCGDNVKFGLKFSRRFLRAGKRRGKDIRAKLDQHNIRLGRKVVKSKVRTTCKCHGISGSCTTRTCWRELSPFHLIGRTLKQKYENSFKVVTYANQATGQSQLVEGLLTAAGENSDSLPPKRNVMVHLEDSPNFCGPSLYSPGTSGRACAQDNCDVMCCGRGYNVKTTLVKRTCQCQVIWCCYVKCKQCISEEEIYLCK